MGLFNKLFEKKKRIEEPLPITDPSEFEEELGEGVKLCEHCQKPIYPHEQRRTFHGKKFHFKCWRIFVKQAKHISFNKS